GRTVTARAGDAVLIPAGVGHRRLGGTADLLVVGAYPPGQPVDLQRSGAADAAAIRRRIAAVGRPGTDPVAGAAGPLARLWGA
ncbi:MAG TPA: cupin, partial [Bauldia sp.]|nr:cupin [Bauldia sp.]